MKTIYVTMHVAIQENEVVVATFPGFRELSINETNEVEYDGQRVDITTDLVAEIEDGLKAEMIAELWEACNAYQDYRIATLGVMKLSQKPEPNVKALANLAWVDAVWVEYKRKRDIITGTRMGNPLSELVTITDPTGSVDGEPMDDETEIDLFDFSQMGELPYSYFEAIAED